MMNSQLQARASSLQNLSEGIFDVLVMGGGINGAGVLRDLALRARTQGTALRLALVDRGHFSSGTSGRNSQLIHGGLRYLKNFEFKLVSEALAERRILLQTAPHLVEPLAFIIPMRDVFSALFYGAGLFLYDHLAGNNRIERHRALSSRELHNLEPALRKFSSGARFFDCRVQSARLVILNLREAASNGALAANYVQVDSYEKASDGLWQVELTDRLSGTTFTVKTRAIVNATGAWSRQSQLRLVRGSHLILPKLGKSENAISYFGRDGRIVFFIPWGRRHAFTLVGTTDVDHAGGPDHVRISEAEVRYLLDVVDEVFPAPASRTPICAYSSLRPLVKDDASSATKTSREHRIWADDRGMIHIAGGKYTTYRRMSEEASDLVASTHFRELASTHRTAETPIDGNTPQRIRELLAASAELARANGLTVGETVDLIKDFGVNTEAVIALLPHTARAGLTRLESAQIAFAAAHEWIAKLTDLMYISTYWGYERTWTRAMLEPYASELGGHLSWGSAMVDREIDAMLTAADQPREL